MKHRRSEAFTLTELLLVLAIITALAALLFPVFSSALAHAKRTDCISSFKQTSAAMTLYMVDYDDRFSTTRYTGALPTEGVTDRTWVQVVLPYVHDFNTFICPADYTRQALARTEYDPDVVLSDVGERYYLASQRVNTGFNFIYLSPLVKEQSGVWAAKPRQSTELSDPSMTILLGDSAFSINRTGVPEGGGNFLVVPPCRYDKNNRDSFGLDGYRPDQIYVPNFAWDRPSKRLTRYGNLYPWHDGKLTIGMVDGSVRVLPIARTFEGCDVRNGWEGIVYDPDRYIWDFN
ncbi:MAG: prepilin-type N-terminal cleavage/methylation domain-containing protein [Fimbriimonadaceae bacterium]|nr:prepilin-type N-terminal cleavage/methylation domain-containing protein [Fimbriimonadaceae bacterium]QYK56379.1 MAG: prepilin-type N-terminal cleavage/methylation domain-containing protein [Fimbriimonadaceae bacterium]